MAAFLLPKHSRADTWVRPYNPGSTITPHIFIGTPS
jgi:hypothetical protein